MSVKQTLNYFFAVYILSGAGKITIAFQTTDCVHGVTVAILPQTNITLALLCLAYVRF